MEPIAVRPFAEQDRAWATALLEQHWGAPCVVSRGRMHQANRLPGFVATRADEPLGLATYRVDGDQCELVSLNSVAQGQGVGTALLEAVARQARQAGCRRLWLTTTNDNLRALRFYQRRGMALVAVHRNAVEVSRRLKPQIPPIGLDGIPLRDELELELML